MEARQPSAFIFRKEYEAFFHNDWNLENKIYMNLKQILKSFEIKPNRKLLRFGPVWNPSRKRRRKLHRQWWRNWRKDAELTKIISVERKECLDTGFQFSEVEMIKPNGSYQMLCELIYGSAIGCSGIVLTNE